MISYFVLNRRGQEDNMSVLSLRFQEYLIFCAVPARSSRSLRPTLC